jgi:hypothetical protein
MVCQEIPVFLSKIVEYDPFSRQVTDDCEKYKSLSDFAESTGPFDVWLKDSAKSITGIDLGLPRNDRFPKR